MNRLLYVSVAQLPEVFTQLENIYSITHAQNGKMGLNELKTEPNAVILDIDFPILDIDLKEFIQSTFHTDPTVTILLAARGTGVYEESLRDAVDYLKCGAQQFIQLPSSKEEVIWALAYATEQTYLARQSTPFSSQSLQNPQYKERLELFLQLLDARLAKGLPITPDDIHSFFNTTGPISDSEKIGLIERLNEPLQSLKEKTKSFSILIVDDEPEVRHQLADVFLPFFTVIQAENGQLGLELASLNKPEVILLDITMPGKKGDALIPEFKQLSPQSEIVIVSGHCDYWLVAKTIQSGAFDYLLKPFNRQYLKTVVRRILQRNIYKNILGKM